MKEFQGAECHACLYACVCTESRDIFPPFYCYISLILTHIHTLLFRSDKRHLLKEKNFKLFISSRLFFPPNNSIDQYDEKERGKLSYSQLKLRATLLLSFFPSINTHSLQILFKSIASHRVRFYFEIRILNCTINTNIFFLRYHYYYY